MVNFSVFFEDSKASEQKSFLDIATRYYNVSVRGVSFKSDPYHAWLSVAEFIRESSNGFLDHVMQQQSLSSDLIFVNTVYFNGTWAFEVPTDGNKQMTFYRDFRCDFAKISTRQLD